MQPTILSIQNVSKVYGSLYALDDVSLEIKQGEIFGLLGPNGAGKTTLSSILATLHPPTTGDVLFNGISIYKNLIAYRKALGFCPQKQNLDTFLTVRENLVFAGRYFLLPEQEIQDRVTELMNELDLIRYADFNIHELSGGNAQRVLIARALIHKPKILILDEPTVGLDPDIRRKLWRLIKRLKAMGLTIILTTHYLDEAEVFADRVCFLEEGHVKLVETITRLKEQYGNISLEEIFLKFAKPQEG